MSISAVNPLIPGSIPVADGSTRVPTKVLGQNEFLKLVVAQLANQDPLKPQTDAEFISQMTSFTTLEQTKNMQTDLAQMRAQQQVLQGMALMNREVTVRSGKSDTAKGVVSGLDMDGQDIKVVVGDKSYPLSDVLGVRIENQN